MRLHDTVLQDAYSSARLSVLTLQNEVNELKAELEKFRVSYCYSLIIAVYDLYFVQGSERILLCLVDGDGNPLCY